MPADRDDAACTGAGVRKPSMNETAGSGRRSRAAGAMGICARQTNWLMAADTHGCVGRRSSIPVNQ
jgi:hypothetical protein